MSPYAQIGGFDEQEFLTGVDYVETPDSGMSRVRVQYDETRGGYVRHQDVRMVIACWKRDEDDVIAAIPVHPASLTTVGGRNADGSIAARVVWGPGYVLENIDSSSVGGAPTVMHMTLTYRKTVPDAQESFPASVTLTCAAGVYTFSWNGTPMLSLDNGTGECGLRGVEFVKLPEIKRVYTVITTVNSITFQQTQTRYYGRMRIDVDGVQFEEIKEVLLRTQYGAGFQIAAAPDSETQVGDDETLTSDYAADIRWEDDGTAYCRLLFAGEPVWDWTA